LFIFLFSSPHRLPAFLSFALSIPTLLTMAILHIPCTCHGVGGVPRLGLDSVYTSIFS
jgi:hypothetical protein